jgi:CRISPR type III-associated protein (TIGR04423 family)
MKKITIQDIDFNLNYEGYYWYSNKKKPVILHEQPISAATFTEIPFIVEGNFYCKSKNISINIKNIDGEYCIYRADLSDLPSTQCQKQQYIAHDLAGVSHFTMLEYWAESAPDPLLENMTTLVPAWSAFIGFTYSQQTN